jgi:hypothetical protein|tara:strand:+ start:160 stop:348 length:189 start_codon:yes stop_codon:yes gene_type:complete
MTNPIPKNSFFATPTDYAELAEMIGSIGTPDEQRMAWLGASLALNLAHNLTENLSKESLAQV